MYAQQPYGRGHGTWLVLVFGNLFLTPNKIDYSSTTRFYMYYTNNKQIIFSLVAALLTLEFFWVEPATANDLTVKEVIAAMKASIHQISEIEASFCVTVEKFTCPEFFQGPNGQGKMSQFQWGFDSKSDAEYLDGTWYFKRGDKIHHEDTHIVFNGRETRGHAKTSNGGKILSGRSNLFTPWITPSTLWGRDLCKSPGPDVIELLDNENTRIIEHKETPKGVVVIRTPIKVGTEDWDLTVWADSKHGFLPNRIETEKAMFDVVMERIDIDEFAEIQPGLWLPILGRVSKYYMAEPETPNGVYANGMTREELENLSMAEVAKVAPLLGFQSKPLGLGTLTVVIDKESLHVNKKISPEKFTLNFPQGTMVWDDITGQGYQIGRWDDPALTSSLDTVEKKEEKKD